MNAPTPQERAAVIVAAERIARQTPAQRDLDWCPFGDDMLAMARELLTQRDALKRACDLVQRTLDEWVEDSGGFSGQMKEERGELAELLAIADPVL